ncbi:hypothetical protein C8R48DRAFT_66503 [Suillus tomentosus]|nr:hypothetical protein C8R48DRAFT_66503 [Suillus tomentosus]
MCTCTCISIKLKHIKGAIFLQSNPAIFAFNLLLPHNAHLICCSYIYRNDVDRHRSCCLPNRWGLRREYAVDVQREVPREPGRGGYNREAREPGRGGYNREAREPGRGGYNREAREPGRGGYNREAREPGRGGYNKE